MTPCTAIYTLTNQYRPGVLPLHPALLNDRIRWEAYDGVVVLDRQAGENTRRLKHLL